MTEREKVSIQLGPVGIHEETSDHFTGRFFRITCPGRNWRGDGGDQMVVSEEHLQRLYRVLKIAKSYIDLDNYNRPKENIEK